ncbi:MAG: hypothetical protein ACO3OY_00440 [bacterium]
MIRIPERRNSDPAPSELQSSAGSCGFHEFPRTFMGLPQYERIARMHSAQMQNGPGPSREQNTPVRPQPLPMKCH